ncbi:hypothetical protein C8Q70DRAFT_949838 [Cubamyces menziesii]|nr:hypothetical protein C8Q70DRAFT_1001337 [Cubamyces menziesii]KAI0663432.1 hypothetical protein C8Q70DRAFT_949838 [Cubamyces menziesii]
MSRRAQDYFLGSDMKYVINLGEWSSFKLDDLAVVTWREVALLTHRLGLP